MEQRIKEKEETNIEKEKLRKEIESLQSRISMSDSAVAEDENRLKMLEKELSDALLCLDFVKRIKISPVPF